MQKIEYLDPINEALMVMVKNQTSFDHSMVEIITSFVLPWLKIQTFGSGNCII